MIALQRLLPLEFSTCMSCCRFQRHLVKVEDEAGCGLSGRDGSSAGNSRLKRQAGDRARRCSAPALRYVRDAVEGMDARAEGGSAAGVFWQRRDEAQAGSDRAATQGDCQVQDEPYILKKGATFFAKESIRSLALWRNTVWPCR